MMEHEVIPPGEIHAPHNWRVADETERLALIVTEADLGKYCWQRAGETEWFLIGHTPAVWKQHIGPAGADGAQGPAGTTTWGGITDKPSTFPPSAHSHAVGDVTGLQTALDAKLPQDFSGLTTDPGIDGTEVIPVSGGFKTTLSAIFTWFKTQANSWTARQTFKDVVDTVYAITDGTSVDIDPANGSIQTWTLGANRTPTATNFVAGQGVTLMVDDGSAYTITWSTIGVTWLTADGLAPTLKTTGYTAIVLWKVGSTVYGK